MKSIAAKFGATAESLRKWIRQADSDDGVVDGVSREGRQQVSRGFSPPRRNLHQSYNAS
jgi:transposase-like protein